MQLRSRPLLSSCVRYSAAGKSLPFFLLSASHSLEIAKVAAKPECEPEALCCHSLSFPPWFPPGAASLDCGNSLPRSTSPCSWPWVLVLPGPALPCLVSSPCLGRTVALCRRQQDLSKGPGASKLDKQGGHARPHRTPAPLLELGLCATLTTPRYVGLGSGCAGGASWGWGWLGSGHPPSSSTLLTLCSGKNWKWLPCSHC